VTKTRAKLYKMLWYLHNLMSVKPVKHVSVSNHNNNNNNNNNNSNNNNSNNKQRYYTPKHLIRYMFSLYRPCDIL